MATKRFPTSLPTLTRSRGKLSRRRSQSRSATIESLEARQLLAVIGAPADQLAPSAGGYLDDLYASWLAHEASGTATDFASTQSSLYQFQGDTIAVQIFAPQDTQAVADSLAAAGLVGSQSYRQHISGMAPLSALPSITSVEGVQQTTIAWAPIYSTGSVNSQGDPAIGSDDVRSLTPISFDGTGVNVAVISDSYDRSDSASTDAADDVLSGDLPTVTVLSDTLAANQATDEGRAMLQVIHDVAPGANLFFSDGRENGALTETSMANAIDSLATVEGADVIVDDLFFLQAPFYQDGIVARAVDRAVNNDGVTYVSAAGNQGDNAYEATFSNSGQAAATGIGGSSPNIWHDFDSSGGVALLQDITVPTGSTVQVVLQHAEPFGLEDGNATGDFGQTNDLNLVLIDPTATDATHPNPFDPATDDTTHPGFLRQANANSSPTDNPLEIISDFTNSAANTRYQIGVLRSNSSGTPLFKYMLVSSDLSARPSIDTFPTNSSTIVGHANAAGAIAVGAAFYQNTPEFNGGTPPQVSDYSGRGGSTVFTGVSDVNPTDGFGDTLITPVVRNQPVIVGPDGVNNTFFGTDIADGPGESDTDPNFFGTSAAAAHIAGVVALMLDADAGQSPAENRMILEDTAVDILQRVVREAGTVVTPGAAAGDDVYSGAGFVDALAAVQQSIGIPTIDLNSATPGFDNTATFNENPGTPVSITNLVGIVDPDDANLASATVTITDLADDPNETIGFSTAGTSIVGAYDPNTGVLTLTGVDSIANYETVLNTLTYDLDGNSPTGTSRSVEVAVSDGANSSSSTVTVTIVPFNDPPTAGDDGPFTTDEDTMLTVAAPGVLANDADPEGATLNAVVVSNPTDGTLTLNADGSFTYMPNADFNGSDSFTYMANDGGADSAPATVSITVAAVNDPPVVVNDTYSTAEDTTLNIAAPAGVLAGDSDVDGDTITAVLDTDVSNGTLNLNADGSFTYTPDADFNGADTFTYFANDGQANSTTAATVTITVNSVNDAPVAIDDAYSTNEDSPLTISAPGVVDNDTDVENDPLTAVSFTQPSNGTLAANADGSFTYTPDADFNGVDTFTYLANDGSANSANPATVTITVNAVNDPPVAVDDTASTNEDTPLTVNLPGVLGNDSDVDGNQITAVLQNDVSNGTLALNADGSYTYTPDADFNGSDSFTYFANDGTANSATAATVTITVNPVNDLPVAVDDNYPAIEDTPLTINAPGVLTNDTDADGDSLTAVVAQTTSNGTLTLNSDGSFNYSPNANFQGIDTFTYRANDGTGDSANIATVTITVAEENDPPVAGDNSYSTDEDTTLTIATPGVLGNDNDTEGDNLTANLISDVTDGTLTLNADGSFDYTPNSNFSGSDSFTYVANDGLSDSNEATVTITVNAVNDPPVATGESYTTDEDTALTVTAPGVLDNDTDVENDSLTAVLVTSTSNGNLNLNSNGSFTYTPNLNFSGSDSFTYLANDGQDDSNTVTVSITIDPVNDAPVFTSSPIVTAQENSPYSYSITTNDVDDVATDLTITAPTLPSWLTFVDNGDGTASLTGTPLVADIGMHPVSLTVADPSNASSPQSFTIEVLPDNVPPTATDDLFMIDEDMTDVTFDVLANDTTFPDTGETLTITGLAGVGLGHSVTIVGSPGSQTLLYSPPADFFGTETFSYTINDGSAPDSNDTAVVTVIVNEINDPPTANDDTFFGIMEDSVDNVFDVLANDTFAPDVNETLTITNVTTPDNGGTVTVSDSGTPGDPSDDVLLYSPAAGFRGTETFEYTIDDGRGGTDTATVNVAVFNQPVFQVASTGDVFAIGSDASDRIIFFTTNSFNSISVRYNNMFFGPFILQPGSTLNADGRGGSDAIIVAGTTDIVSNFEGGPGNDYLAGNIADDTLSGGEGNDTILGSEGDNLLMGGEGNDRLEGRNGDDTLEGGGGNDRIGGSGGNDVIRGGDGNDFLNGGNNDDLIFGGGGNDNINGGAGNDAIVGGDDADSITGQQGNDVLIGGLGADRLRGQSGDDLLLGGASDYDTDEAALLAILSEWSSGGSIDDIRTGATTGGNPLSITSGTIDDSTVDDLTGDTGTDWFLAFNDFVRDERLGDIVDR